MRVRGVGFLALSVPLWVYVIWDLKAISESSFEYELGSVAMPFPVGLKLAGLLALGFAVAGILLLVGDAVRWRGAKAFQRSP
jgi:hypothetical protein